MNSLINHRESESTDFRKSVSRSSKGRKTGSPWSTSAEGALITLAANIPDSAHLLVKSIKNFTATQTKKKKQNKKTILHLQVI